MHKNVAKTENFTKHIFLSKGIFVTKRDSVKRLFDFFAVKSEEAGKFWA
jgi:hypothetical protein